MRFNDSCLRQVAAQGPFQMEGRLSYKAPREGYRERWFRLRNNLLFAFRINSSGIVNAQDPMGFFVLEKCNIQSAPLETVPFTFYIEFYGDGDKKHFFSCTTQSHCNQWVEALRNASHASLVESILYLKSQIIEKTGKDPMPDLLPGRSTAESFIGLVPQRLQRLKVSAAQDQQAVKRHTAPAISERREQAAAASNEFKRSNIQDLLSLDQGQGHSSWYSGQSQKQDKADGQLLVDLTPATSAAQQTAWPLLDLAQHTAPKTKPSQTLQEEPKDQFGMSSWY